MKLAQVDGLKEVQAEIARKLKEIPALSLSGLLIAGHDVIALSKERTPVDTGTLKADQDASRQGDDVVLRVRSNYAVYVHEDLEARHEVGQAKFLESAARDSIDLIVKKATEKAKQ